MPYLETEDCLLLYLDILGFKQLVKEKLPVDIRRMLQEFRSTVDRYYGERAKVIQFSDTILVYDPSPAAEAHADLMCVFANHMTNWLLARSVPFSGVMVSGPFYTFTSGSEGELSYFGQALIDAHEKSNGKDKSHKWIGIVVDSSAAEKMSQPLDPICPRWRGRPDNTFLLNPFWDLWQCFTSGKGSGLAPNVNHCATQLDAIGFLCDQAKRFAEHPRIVLRYHNTLAFAREMLGDECFEWACCEGEKGMRSRR